MQTNYANLFSTQPLDRLEEIYVKTMDEMDDTTLQAYCMTAKYTKSLCNDAFWSRRIKEHNLELLLPYRSLYPNLMTFYFNVRKDACYIVADVGEGEEDAYAFNDIKLARRAFTNLINNQYGMGYDNDEEVEPDYNELTSNYQIYVLFNNIVLTEENISEYSIFDIRQHSVNYLNPSILDFPLLSHERDLLYYIKKRSGVSIGEIGILPFDDEHLRLLSEKFTIYYLITDFVLHFESPLNWNKNAFGIVAYAFRNEVFILIDTNILSASQKYSLGYTLRISNWKGNTKVKDHRLVIIDQDVYHMITNMLNCSYRANKEGRSIEVIPNNVIIEALLTGNKVEPLSKIKDLLNHEKQI